MVDLSRVSEAVQKVVNDAKAIGGVKSKIDTREEYQELANYLAGNAAKMNSDERGYIDGFMIEYQKNEAVKDEKEFEKSVTQNTKDLVKKVKDFIGKKKEIDNAVEANMLAEWLHTESDVSESDLIYVARELAKAGYAHLIPDRLVVLEKKVDFLANELQQNNQLDALQNNVLGHAIMNDAEQQEQIGALSEEVKQQNDKNKNQDARLNKADKKNNEQDARLDRNENHDNYQDRRLNKQEFKNWTQDVEDSRQRMEDRKQNKRLNDLEK